MMRWIVSASLRSRGLVLALGVGVMLFGIVQLREMPRDVLPEFLPTTVEVQTEALGLSAPEVEQLITVPLEQDLLNGVAFLDFIRSESVPGLSRIELIFEPGTDLADARQVVNERLTQAFALPNVSSPPQMLQPLSSTSRVMMIGLTSEELSLIDLSLLARWTIRPTLMGVPGVANVAVWGQREQQLQVQVDPARLQAEGVTLDQVIRTTGNALWTSPLSFLEASTPGVGGFFDTASQRLNVQHSLPIKTPEDLARVPLENEPGTPVNGQGTPQRLGDVTTVVEDHQPLIGDAVLTGRPGLLLVVEKFPEANTLEVTEELDRMLEGLRPGLGSVEVDSSLFRPARYIEESTDNLRSALLVGLALLVVALGALVFDWRTVAVTLVALALSLSAAIGVLSVRGETINVMVVGGLVLALLVLIDDAVVTSEAIRSRSGAPDSGDTDESILNRVRSAVLGVRGPLGYGTVILLLALLPILALSGEMGAFVPPLALSYAGAVVASMLVALTVTPALGAILVSRGSSGPRESPVMRWLRSRYDRALSAFVGTHHLAAIALGLLLVVGIAAAPLMDRGPSLVPAFKDRDLLVHWNGAPGTSLREMSRITHRAARELRDLPGVHDVGAHIGRAVGADQIVGVNSSELWITLDSSADYDGTSTSIEEVVNGYPGIERSVLTYPKERIDDVLVEPDGVEGKDLTVRVFGQDLDTLRAEAGDLKQDLEKVAGVEGARVELPVEEPTLEVEVDLDRARAIGIKPGDVRRAAATFLSGIAVGNLFEEQKIFEVVVWGAPETRRSLADIQDLVIDTPAGGKVVLGDVADVRVTPTPNVIRHDDVSRHLDIGFDVEGRDVTGAASDIEDRIRSTGFPLEYHAELLDDYATRQASRRSFLALSFAAAVGILLLLQAAFGSWRLASAMFLALPAALTGAALAALIDGDLASIGSLVGFLAVFGLAARNGVVLVRHAQDLEDQQGEAFGPELVRRAARDRMAPTLTTAAAAGAIFVPLLLSGDRAGMEIVGPMGAVIVGGLVTSTLVSLFVVPALYLRFGYQREDQRERDIVVDLTTVELDEAPRTQTTIDA